MQLSHQLSRVLLFLTLLTGLLAGMIAPVLQQSAQAAPAAVVSPGDVVISEFRFLGPAGASDEFIELYNPKNTSVDISGLKIMGSNNAGATSIRATLGVVTLLPGQYYLLVNSGASAGLLAIKDVTYASGITADGGIAVTLNDGTTIIDQVGLSLNSAYKEGTFLAPLSGTANQSYARKGSGCADTGNNSADFVLTSPSNPRNTASPAAPCADLSLTMSESSATPGVGTNEVFTINVANGGPNDATNVTIKDILPLGLTYISNDLGLAYNNLTGIWTIGSLISGISKTLKITANVATAGGKTDSAEVWTSDQVDPNSTAGNGLTTENDYAKVLLVPPGTADLSLTQTVNNATPNVGDSVVFAITVSNAAGNDDATGVQVKDLLPAGLIYVSDNSGGAYDRGIPAPPNTGIWTVGTLASGTSKTLKITANVSTSGVKTNLAEVWLSDQFDPDSTPGNASTVNEDDDATVIVTPSGGQADLSLIQGWSKASPGIAGTIVFTIIVSNAGPFDATNVEVKDLLPTGLAYVSDTGGGTYNKTTGIWTVGTLTKSGLTSSKTLNITAKVASSGTRTNLAEVWQSDQSDPNSTPGNASTVKEDDDASAIPLVADLSLTKTMSNVTPSVGADVVFTITVSNSASFDDATNVQVKDILPTSFTYVSDNSGGAYDRIDPNSATYGIWTVGTLASGTSKTLTITTTLNTTALIINKAEVYQSDQIDPDSVPNNGSRTEDDDASAPSADLFLTQSVNDVAPNIGDNIVYTIAVVNAGPAGTTGVQVRDLLPAGLTYVSSVASLGTYSNSSGIWTVGPLTSGASQTLKITATVNTIGVKTNPAEVWKSDEADPDSTPGNSLTTEDDYASTTITTHRSVIINEVAWSGTAASSNDQWIELYNPGSTSIDITGWTLKSASGSLSITLSGKINSVGFFLLERGSDNTVLDTAADQVYPGLLLNKLSDTGEVLTLRDGSGNDIDTANGNGGPWPQGSKSPNFGSMERQGTSAESDGTWVTNNGNPRNGRDANNGFINGTPRRFNSVGIAIAPTSTPVRPPTPGPVPPAGRPLINEFLPRPGFDWNQDGKVNVFDEFIEIKNVGNANISLGGWTLDNGASQDATRFSLPAVTLKIGERMVFYGLQTHILLSDGGGTIRLISSTGKIYDAYTYAVVKVEDKSLCRLPDGKFVWYKDCLPTPNLTNTREGVVPAIPGGGVFESPVCDLPDTIPADFLFAECRGYGANIWHAFYWDKPGWLDQLPIYDNKSKWESFVE